MDEARSHVALLGLFGRLGDRDRELRRDLDLLGIAAELMGAVLQYLDPLLELGPRPPARQPAGGVARGALDGGLVVSAQPQRERIALGLGIHLDVLDGVVLALVRD